MKMRVFLPVVTWNFLKLFNFNFLLPFHSNSDVLEDQISFLQTRDGLQAFQENEWSETELCAFGELSEGRRKGGQTLKFHQKDCFFDIFHHMGLIGSLLRRGQLILRYVYVLHQNISSQYAFTGIAFNTWIWIIVLFTGPKYVCQGLNFGARWP